MFLYIYIMDYLAYCLLRHTFINTYQLHYYLHILTHSSSSELELEQVHSHLPRRSSHLLTTSPSSPSSLSSPPHHLTIITIITISTSIMIMSDHCDYHYRYKAPINFAEIIIIAFTMIFGSLPCILCNYQQQNL